MKVDMHCHSWYSNDGNASPEALILAAKRKGLDGIAITDHNTTKAWSEAISASKKHGFGLILGQELKIKENGKTIGEILAYFIKQEISPKGKTAKQIVDEIHAQNGIAIMAHPFNWKKPFHNPQSMKGLVDGSEAFNARSQTAQGNKQAEQFAKDNNFLFTAGSDCHSTFEIGNAYLESPANNLEEFKNDLLNKRVKVVGKQSGWIVQIFAFTGKVRNLFWKP